MSKKKHKKKKYTKIKYRSRRDMMLQEFPNPVLDLWFGSDKEKINDFGNFLMMQDELDNDDSISSLLDGKNIYDQKIDSIKQLMDLIGSEDIIKPETKKEIIKYLITNMLNKQEVADMIEKDDFFNIQEEEEENDPDLNISDEDIDNSMGSEPMESNEDLFDEE